MPNVTLESLAKQIVDFAVAIDARVDGLQQVMTERFEAVDHRLDSVDQRLDSVDHRLERIETKLDRAIGSRGRAGRATTKG